MTQETTIYRDTIALKNDTEMSTGYRGRGETPKTHTFPAGTWVMYTRMDYCGAYVAHDGDTITEIRHMVSAYHGGERYSAVKIFVPKEEGDDGKTKEDDL